MKKLFGLAALVVAIALVSFTNVKRATHTMSFQGSTFSAAQVADESYWREITPITCSGTAEVACRVVVPTDAYVIFDSNLGVNIIDVSVLDLDAQVGYTSGLGVEQFKPILASGSTGTFTPTNKLHN